MRCLFRQTGKIKIAAVFVPLALSVSAAAAPVHDSSAETIPPMTFDSIGSMLQDMDREQSLEPQGRDADMPVSMHTNDHACPTEDVNSRMDEVYSSLQTRIEQIDLAKIARLETKITMRRASDIEVMREQQVARIREARAFAATAMAGIHAAITAMEDQHRGAVSNDEKMMAEAVEEALRAAEATLANQP